MSQPTGAHHAGHSMTATQPVQTEETRQMVEELKALVRDGDPAKNYHWNRRLAELWRSRLGQGSPQEQFNIWLEYCKQSLYAGGSQVCIDELERYFNPSNRPYVEVITDNNKMMFELLALAYLRLGEQVNCQRNHTPQSCIVPLQQEGFHAVETGSRKAIEIYSVLQDSFPSHKNLWLLNVAYMTLGKYPDGVPARHLLNFPNYALEQRSFPAFKEIAMSLGLAVNGRAGGTCVDDFNNDGFLDIFITSSGMEDNAQLFFNDQHGGFVNVTKAAGLEGLVGGLNCVHADYNNDGYRDILILRGGWVGEAGNHPNSLLKNMGNGTFQDVTRSSGMLSYHPTQTANWGDFDRDGDLDLFIGNESQSGQPHPCELYRNNGDGTFTEVASQHGLGHIKAYVKGVAWGDINNDGWLDLYVSILGGNNLLFKNNQGRFTEIAMTAGVMEPFFSFPCWFWDVNNDGWQDIFVSGYDARSLDEVAGDYARELQGLPVTSEMPKLYINNGDETFTEASKAFGVSKTMYTMGSNFGDLDNDGFLDFYVGTGAPGFTSIVPNRMFRNVAGQRFEEVTSSGNFGHIQKGHGIAFADLDRDGDQDIYEVIGGALEGDTFTNILYENPISINNWLVIELQGTVSSRDAIGSRLELLLDNGQTLYRTVSSGGSFGASPLHREIGLGKATSIKELTIHWQNGEKQTFKDIEVNQRIFIKEGEHSPVPMSYEPTPFKVVHNDDEHHHHH